jgi:TRAP-type C4-dicarboxylate transport system substrate-binding protein
MLRINRYFKEETMRKFKLLSLILVLALVMTSFAACGGGGDDSAYSADNPLKLRLASDAPTEHIATVLNEELCAMIEEKTEGRIVVDYFGGGAMGDYNTVFNEVKLGTIDAAQITIPDALDARLGAAYMPWYALSFEQAKELYGPDSYMFEFFSEVVKTQDVEFLGFVLEGFIGMALVKNADDPFTPGTDKGINIRVPGMNVFKDAQVNLGYNVSEIPYGEVTVAVQQGRVDGWVGGTPNINYAWLGETIKYMYINYAHAEATSYVLSAMTLAKMTEEDQAIVKQCFLDQSAKSFDNAQANEEVFKQKLTDAGVEVVEFTEEQLMTMAKFVRGDTWTGLEESLGADLIAKFREEVAAYE